MINKIEKAILFVSILLPCTLLQAQEFDASLLLTPKSAHERAKFNAKKSRAAGAYWERAAGLARGRAVPPRDLAFREAMYDQVLRDLSEDEGFEEAEFEASADEAPGQ